MARHAVQWNPLLVGDGDGTFIYEKDEAYDDVIFE
jgi:hypothetical protein